MPDLLLELFSEEIPARMQAGAARDLERLMVGALTDRGYLFEGIKAFAGPRRLTLAIAGLPAKQYDVREGFKEELDEWYDKDPINVLRKYLAANYDGIDKELERIDEEADKIVAEAVQYAEDSPVPTYEDLINNIYV